MNTFLSQTLFKLNWWKIIMILFMVIIWAGTGNIKNLLKLKSNFEFSCESKSPKILIEKETPKLQRSNPSFTPRYDHLYYPKHISQQLNYLTKGQKNFPVSIPIYLSSSNQHALKIHYDTMHIYNIVINIWKNWFVKLWRMIKHMLVAGILLWIQACVVPQSIVHWVFQSETQW